MIVGRGGYLVLGARGSDGEEHVYMIMRADCHVRTVGGISALCRYVYTSERPVRWTHRRMMEKTAVVWEAK